MMATSIMTQRFTVSFFKQRHGDSLARGSLWLHFSGISAPWYSGWVVGLLRDLEAVVGQNRFMKHRVIFLDTNQCGDQTEVNWMHVKPATTTSLSRIALLSSFFISGPPKLRPKKIGGFVLDKIWREIEFPPQLNKIKGGSIAQW